MIRDIRKIAKKLGLTERDLSLYGFDKAKIINANSNPNGKLILVSAMNPGKFGEGKTTVSIGLGDALSMMGKKVCLALREPSLGPVFGVKGGATGGGRTCVEPKSDINLHFTGDFHAITSANNLLCAMIDNHIFQGNALNIDPNRVQFKRCMDMNDRALREITINEENLKSNVQRQDGFDITAGSEIMAILCLAKDLDDLKRRCGNIIIGFDKDGKQLYAKDLKAENAMAILLKDAIKPNLVQTTANTPAIIHGGPFANIAHGCNSVIATKTALSLADYVVTEAGFGADLGGEKFLDMKCRLNDLNPNMVVIVATIKALKLHGGSDNKFGIKLGFENLERHVNNMRNVFNKKTVVALNKFADDKKSEIELVKNLCSQIGVKCIVSDGFAKGGRGCLELAQEAINICDEPITPLHYAYDFKDGIEKKANDLARNIYGAKEVEFSDKAKEKIKYFEPLAKNFPIIMAKTQYSFSDDQTVLNAPKDYIFHVSDIELKNGAEFLVLIAGKMSLMPGLPKIPNAEKMEIIDGKIFNLK